ncbi:MAG TPA: hypothetical protein RMG95_14275 [Polyangiaceae bacterium LLY-WYZ-15_(1-7)]|nr:hypothetical protein [Polyangiaceae bacterium LLY-WYZ-15_(1-7)]HJL36852.1 hypothetical protein [Polyangiaceae bacterium LLY-WYZ-15_(1-7)]
MALSIGSGCKVTSEDIEYWKGTVKGPGKIVAVMLAERYPIELRTQAAQALVEMERNDVNGVGELQRALATLKAQDPEAAQQIVDGMVPALQSMMRGGEDAQQSDDLGPPMSQQRAKDAAYLLVEHAGPQARQQLTEAVVGWYAVDFAERHLAGDYSAEQVVRSLGAPAADQLVSAMSSHQPQQALVKIAELIGQIGNEQTKQRAGERLVEIEQEMEGDEFVQWLQGRITESLEEAGREIDENRVRAIALLNRENFINDGALPAMKHLAHVDAVRNRLLAVAQAAPPEDAPGPLIESLNMRRQKALQALEGNASADQLDALLGIALNEENPVNVRDYAFDRVGDIRDRRAIPRLWPLVEFAENEDLGKRLRWRAGELVLAIGGAEIVGEFLSRLPSDRGVEYEPEELAGYATRMSQMTPQPVDVLERQLRSPNWYNKVIALRFTERRGTEADVAKMRRLASDRTETVGDGWARQELETVGKVAENAIEALQERLAEPEEGEAGGEGEAAGE